MTYEVIKYIKGNPYRYLVRSVREGDRVRQVFVRYLGRADKPGREYSETEPVERRERIRRPAVTRPATEAVAPTVKTEVAEIETAIVARQTEPKVVWVDSWRDIAKSVLEKGEELTDDVIAEYEKIYGGASPSEGLDASYNREQNTIYAVRGKATPFDVEHERYHALRTQEGSKSVAEQSPDEFVVEELEADKYAYNKIGHFDDDYGTHLGGIVYDLTRGISRMNPVRAMELIYNKLEEIQAPSEMLNAYSEFKSTAFQDFGEEDYKKLRELKIPKRAWDRAKSTGISYIDFIKNSLAESERTAKRPAVAAVSEAVVPTVAVEAETPKEGVEKTIATPEDVMATGEYLVRGDVVLFGGKVEGIREVGGTWATDSLALAKEYGQELNFVPIPKNPLSATLEEITEKYLAKELPAFGLSKGEWDRLRRKMLADGYDAFVSPSTAGFAKEGARDYWILEQPKLMKLEEVAIPKAEVVTPTAPAVEPTISEPIVKEPEIKEPTAEVEVTPVTPEVTKEAGVIYHGSPVDFGTFDVGKQKILNEISGRGLSFTEDPNLAKQYALGTDADIRMARYTPVRESGFIYKVKLTKPLFDLTVDDKDIINKVFTGARESLYTEELAEWNKSTPQTTQELYDNLLKHFGDSTNEVLKDLGFAGLKESANEIRVFAPEFIKEQVKMPIKQTTVIPKAEAVTPEVSPAKEIKGLVSEAELVALRKPKPDIVAGSGVGTSIELAQLKSGKWRAYYRDFVTPGSPRGQEAVHREVVKDNYGYIINKDTREELITSLHQEYPTWEWEKGITQIAIPKAEAGMPEVTREVVTPTAPIRPPILPEIEREAPTGRFAVTLRNIGDIISLEENFTEAGNLKPQTRTQLIKDVVGAVDDKTLSIEEAGSILNEYINHPLLNKGDYEGFLSYWKGSPQVEMPAKSSEPMTEQALTEFIGVPKAKTGFN